ncbi:MAG: DNA replication/repair protein RecF [Clostridia bacterium]|nr:DNA replication/repair protein RecF [Clostridia bacterium]
MRLEYLSVEGFRNYQQVKLSFNKSPVIFVGENAQGKTNLLESIYYLATGTAFRSNKDRELINWDKDYFKIGAKVISRGERPVDIEVNYINFKKNIKINGIRKNTLQELFGNLNIVLFSPEDLKLVKGAPEDRRNFLNREISQISNQYYYFLAQYNKILVQRNTALKQWQKDRKGFNELLNIWDNQLVYYGARIVKGRFEFVEKLIVFAKKIHSLLTGNQEELELLYQTNLCKNNSERSLNQIVDGFFKKLHESREEELIKGITVAGPQRDDLLVITDGKETKNFGSQGQQRSAVLSIKLALLSLFKEKTGSYPVLLLDDVLSELDEKRKNYLLELTGGQIQTFITTTSLNLIKSKSLEKGQVFEIERGIITPRDNQPNHYGKEEL